jgi:sugar phosphate isomerase/epimerase
MELALSTRWNAGRHSDGEAMISEIRELGFQRVELGYDLRRDLVEGVQRAVAGGLATVGSVHNYCPVPTAAPKGHPELFTLASRDRRMRELAVRHTSETIRFAAEMGAKVVVMHAGNVSMPRISPKLYALAEAGQSDGEQYRALMMKLLEKREKKASRHLVHLREGIARLLPVLEETGVRIGIENLPSWEALPTEAELERLLNEFDSPLLGFWNDMGHGQIRENVGLSNHLRWLERLRPFLLGMHVHDVIAPVADHVMPPQGCIDFERFREFAQMDICLVVEPTPRTPAAEIGVALEYLNEVWG